MVVVQEVVEVIGRRAQQSSGGRSGAALSENNLDNTRKSSRGSVICSCRLVAHHGTPCDGFVRRTHTHTHTQRERERSKRRYGLSLPREEEPKPKTPKQQRTSNVAVEVQEVVEASLHAGEIDGSAAGVHFDGRVALPTECVCETSATVMGRRRVEGDVKGDRAKDWRETYIAI